MGFSFNPYVWNEYIDPEAGVLRLVFGLGTRAVDRSDDDYTRVVALNAPERRPESDFDEVRQYSQRKVDVLDLEANQLVSRRLRRRGRAEPDLPVRDVRLADGRRARARGPRREPPTPLPWCSRSTSCSRRRRSSATCARCCRSSRRPTTTRWTSSSPPTSSADDEYKINLVQCRPLQVGRGRRGRRAARRRSRRTTCVLEAHGAVIGQSRAEPRSTG